MTTDETTKTTTETTETTSADDASAGQTESSGSTGELTVEVSGPDGQVKTRQQVTDSAPPADPSS